MSLETLGDVIRARRDELGLSEDRLAEQVGVSPETLRDWESGGSEPPSGSTRIALAIALGISGEILAPDESSTDSPDHLAAPDIAPMPDRFPDEPQRGRRLRLEEETGEYDDDTESDDGESPIAGTLATIKESELVNNLKEADPITSVKESEIVATVKQKLADTFGPDETPSEKAPLLDPERRTKKKGQSKEGHSLTQDLYHEPSYVEDPDEMDHYRNRWIITAFVVIVLLMVAFWAMGQAQASLADGWNRMFEMLNI